MCDECEKYKEASRKINTRLNYISSEIFAVLCSQNYWTADEVCDAVSQFLNEIPKENA